ncbi:MAG: PKD domain-containing protein, partial [Candidatus Desantisbacteria bacterium]
TSVSLTLICDEAATRTITALVSNDDSFPSPVMAIPLLATTTTGISWNLKDGLEEGYRTVYVKFIDQIDNSFLASDSIILDTHAPTDIKIAIQGLLINGNKYTKQSTVTLTLSSDNTVKEMYISGDVAGAGVNTWIAYAINPTATLNANDGKKTISVKVKDEAGNISEQASDFIYLDTTKPVAIFTANPSTVKQGELIKFDADSSIDTITTTLSLDNLTYKWDFGDKNYGEGEVVSHSYKDVGTYTVILTVTDVLGWVGTTTVDVKITDANIPVISETRHIPSVWTTGDQGTITCNVSDNVKVNSVILYYTQPGSVIENNVAMTSISGTDTFGTYTKTITASNATGLLTYYIKATDNENNLVRDPASGFYQIPVMDNDKPEIVMITNISSAGNSQAFVEIKATVTDNVKIYKVYLYYEDITRGMTTQGSDNSMSIEEIQGQVRATGLILVPYTQVGSITYWIEAVDGEGNSTFTQQYWLSITDDVDPTGEVVINSGTATTGITNTRNIRLWISGSDNIRVEKMRVKESL